jgi:hypothetical protein
MSLFSKILEKLGMKPAEAKPAPAPEKPKVATLSKATKDAMAKVEATERGPSARAIPMVDVVGKLEGLAAKSTEKLNWKESIVDLLKLLNLDSSFEARKELAIELGCPADKMSDSARMNVWLHKTVLQKLAANGGNIPKELLD